MLDESRTLFLLQGYDATSIENIATASGLGRAAFYRYFRSKQDVLMALGRDAEQAGMAVARRLRRLAPGAELAELTRWVSEFFAFFDEHGPFITAAFQAAYADPELRAWGLAHEMAGAKALGAALLHLRGGGKVAGVDPVVEGLALLSMLERFWYHWRVAGAPIDEATVARSIAHLVWPRASQ